MRQVQIGDIFSIATNPKWDNGAHHYVVHGCNAQGVMGSGIAKTVKAKYPHVFDAYRKEYDLAGLHLGQIIPVAVEQSFEHGGSFNIVNAITQQNYGRDERVQYVFYSAIQSSFQNLKLLLQPMLNDTRQRVIIHYPMIGAGLGGGEWAIISDIINDCLRGVDHVLWVHE